MQYIFLNEKPELQGTIFSDVLITENYSLYRCDFTALETLELKIEFLSNYCDSMNNTRQFEHALTVHNKSEYFKFINEQIDTGDFTSSNGFVINLREMIAASPVATYKFYSELIVNEDNYNLEVSLINSNSLPENISDRIVFNYFSNTFMHALLDTYGETVCKFVLLDLNLKYKVLAFKIEGNGRTGYYNLSYKKPYNGIALI